jgi:hypothetical protein
MSHAIRARLVRLAATLLVFPPVVLACSGGKTSRATTTTGSITSGSTTGGGAGTTTGAGGSPAATSNTGSTSVGTTTGGIPDAGCSCPMGKHCDPGGTGQCLDCVMDSDCAAPLVCQSSASYLAYGECVQCCETRPTCPAGQVCDLSLGARYHQCVAHCTVDGGKPPCPSIGGVEPQHCSLLTGTCVPGCASNIDCVAPLVCTDGGTCIGCVTPLDCPYSNPGCDEGVCGFCVNDSSCPPGFPCDHGICTCSDGGVCGGDAPVCMGDTCGCVDSTDCASRSEVCAIAHACVPPCNDGGTQCSWDQYCYADGGECGFCEDDSQCVGFDAGARCVTTNLGLVQCGCYSSADCGELGVCAGYACGLSCLIDGGTDCSFFQEFCDPTSGLCGPCTVDSQCSGNAYGSACVSGNCGCRVQNDCAGGQVCDVSCIPSCLDGGTDCSLGGYYYTSCDPATGLCGPCTSDLQCIGSDTGPHCLFEVSGNCGCRSTIDCTSPNVCSPTTGSCVPSCVDGGTPCAGLVCDSRSGLCVQCLDDSQCTTGAPLCLNDIDAGTYCVQCLADSDCPVSLPFCDKHFYDHACVASCVLPDGGTYCQYGVCDVSTTLCVGCLSDSDCQAGVPRCTVDVDAGNNCVQCLTAGDCGDAGPCASQSFLCGHCSIDADCPSEVPICAFAQCTDGGF